jgi:GNAT superfamily N-acetyltransferase
MLKIRKAEASEAETLTAIAVASEAYWGYDADFIDRFKTLYKVTEEFIKTNPVYVMVEGENIVGFYGIVTDSREASLEYLYIEPGNIGKGYGKALWKHAVYICENLGIKELNMVTSPQAKEFYIKMGAVYTGETDSIVVKGRKIPKLVYTLSN